MRMVNEKTMTSSRRFFRLSPILFLAVAACSDGSSATSSSSGTAGGGGIGGEGGSGGGGGIGGGGGSGGSGGIGGGPAVCGNGVVEAGEACDLGAENSDTGACTSGCKEAACGDGLVQVGVEACDDGNVVDGDGCNKDCVISGAVLATWSINGPGTTSDEATSVRLDSQGNIVIAGAVGVPGNPGHYDAVVTKLDPMGNLVWFQTYNGAASQDDQYFGVAVDAQNNVIAVGHESLADGTTNVLVRKHAPDGTPIWVKSFDGPAKGNDHGWGVAVNAAGDIFVAGTYAVSGQGPDILVMKLAGSNGAMVWEHLQNGNANDDDEAYAIAVDGAFVIAAGQTTVAQTGADTWVRKLKDDGGASTTVWTRTENGATSGYDTALGVAVAPSGDVFVAGLETSANNGQDAMIRMYGPSGDPMWSQTYDGQAHQHDNYWAVAADGNGNAVVTGFEVLANMTRDIITRKYAANGKVIWTDMYNGSGNGDDYGEGITTSPTGEVFTVGAELTSNEGYNAWIHKLAP